MTIARRNLGLPDLPRTSLLADWRFTDWNDTQTARDYSGGGRHLTFGGSGSAAGDDPQRTRAGVTFTSASSQFLGGAGVAVFSGSSFSVIAACRVTGSGNRSIIGATGTGGIQVRFTTNDVLEVLKANTASVGTSTNGYGNVWQIAAVTYDGTLARFYRDGAPNGSASSAQTMSVQNSYVGKRAGTDFYSGEMAYLAAWDRALDMQEVAYASVNIARHVGLLPPRKILRFAPSGAPPSGGLLSYPGMAGGFGRGLYPSASDLSGGMKG